MLDVGTGVGYLEILDPKHRSRACLFRGRGSPGEEDRGSNAGRSDVAGRFTPATVWVEEAGGRLGSSTLTAGVFSRDIAILNERISRQCSGMSN